MSQDVVRVLICDFCGAPGATKIGDQCVCPDCYEKAGSCCMEFGGDDLWKRREEKEPFESK